MKKLYELYEEDLRELFKGHENGCAFALRLVGDDCQRIKNRRTLYLFCIYFVSILYLFCIYFGQIPRRTKLIQNMQTDYESLYEALEELEGEGASC